MASRPLRPCAHRGCPNLTRDVWCPQHKPKHKRRVSADYHAWYTTDEWQQLRAEHLLIEPFCRECARAGERTPATVVDHIRPHRGDRRLFLDRSNYQSLCKRHHDQKTALERKQDTIDF